MKSNRQKVFERQVQKARKAIVRGDIEPKVRPVALSCKCAYRTAQAILATLTNDGVIVREGRGWKVPDLGLKAAKNP